MVVEPNAQGAEIELTLPAGRTELPTYFDDADGFVSGAYFTEVEALGKPGANPE